jgi:calcium/proton exchanger cax
MDQWSAGLWLVIVTVATAFTADILVGSIDETAQQLKIPKRFIGLILLPLVGNAAEHVTSVWMACKGEHLDPSQFGSSLIESRLFRSISSSSSLSCYCMLANGAQAKWN